MEMILSHLRDGTSDHRELICMLARADIISLQA
jgi:hypothetical protein